MRKTSSPTIAARNNHAGFSLIELVVAMAIFSLISGAAISLFWQQQINSQTMTGQVGLNLALRNAVAQIEMDVANAGSGFLQTGNTPGWPIGVTITNNVVAQGNTCKTGNYTYGANCFDQLNIIQADVSTQPINATNSTGSNGGASPCSITSDTSTGTAYGQAAPGLTLAQTAAKYPNGSELLFLNSSGTQITTVVLTQAAAATGSAVQFTFNATDSGLAKPHGLTAVADDPLGIASCKGNLPCSLCFDSTDAADCSKATQPSRVNHQFCANDWILKLSPVIYAVDITTDPYNPRLTRQVGLNGTPRTVMDQIIGFKVGATIWNDGNNANQFGDQGAYEYDASNYCNNINGVCPAPPTLGDVAFNYTLIRSIRVSLIGRTIPDWRGTYTFRNGFDGGPYQVQGQAVVVNPRNMSMND